MEYAPAFAGVNFMKERPVGPLSSVSFGRSTFRCVELFQLAETEADAKDERFREPWSISPGERVFGSRVIFGGADGSSQQARWIAGQAGVSMTTTAAYIFIMRKLLYALVFRGH